ncbi:MAG TPA: chemotaxis protein CheW [Candidatus Competibacteraceae bacterium]|nr:chemotaxis protein CheW [Candidatus Competibacteraceae bacterium]
MSGSASGVHPFDLLLEIDRRSAGRYHADYDMLQVSERGGRLALRLGDWRLMFAMADVSEIIPLPRITRVPGVKPWFVGIANLRGTVISIADLQAFLMEKPTKLHPHGRVLILRAGEWDCGVLMDEVIGMRHFGEEQQLPSLDGVEAPLRPYITAAYQADEQCWLAFDAPRLLRDAAFLAAAG